MLAGAEPKTETRKLRRNFTKNNVAKKRKEKVKETSALK
jgi:hypothetical protein